MWKFKASKFKNAAPKVLKKEEWLSDISANNVLHSCGNHIEASADYIVFNTDQGGTNTLGIVPLDAKGRTTNLFQIHAHSENVTDFDFSPFDDRLLTTASQDATVKIWKLPEELSADICNPELTLTREEKRIENVQWHPLASDILAVSTHNLLKIFDVSTQSQVYSIDDFGDQIQSFDWRGDGSMMVSSCKDKKIRIIDPRAATVAQSCNGHHSINDSRAIWLGDKDQILSTGFDMMRAREVVLRDTRNLSTPVKSMSLDTSNGILMPFYDEDTGMLFLAGKGDTCINYLEITDKDPYFMQNSTDTVEQIKGACVIPKKACDAMSCEVNRVLILSRNAIVPLPYIVPRKSYNDFHGDLFPDTFDGRPTMSSSEWCAGANIKKNLMSLDPAGRNSVTYRPVSSTTSTPTTPKPQDNDIPVNKAVSQLRHVSPSKPTTNSSQSADFIPSKPSVLLREKKNKAFAAVRHSKFRHLKGTTQHRDNHIYNLRNLCKTMPGESDMFHANKDFCAVPLAGPGGTIAILKTEERGRLPDTGVSVIQNGALLTDFVFDPFDTHTIAAACDDAKIRIWNLQGKNFNNTEGSHEIYTEPEIYLHGHTEKIYFVRFHPLAKNLLASAAYDMTVRLWDASSGDELMSIQGHTDTIFCLSWSPDGDRFATVCKDGKVRIYNPRQSPDPVQEGPGPEGTRGARIEWVCDGKYLVVSGFDRGTCQTLFVYDAEDLPKGALSNVEVNNTPSILVPYYDVDSSTLFLTSRGESTVHAYEVATEHPHLFELSSYTGDGLHQALSFLPKSAVNVQNVEFAKAMRLTQTHIEPVSFTVPRVKTEFFQDDIFPETKVTWLPTMTCDEWMSGSNTPQKTISLMPKNMTKLSDAPPEAPKERKYESFDSYVKTHKTDEEKKEELLSAITNKLDLSEAPLPQDQTEGCDDDEWD